MSIFALAGAAKGLANVSREKREYEKEREIRTEQIMADRKNMVMQLAAQRASSYGGSSSSSRGGSSSSGGVSSTQEVNAYGEYLVRQGASPESVARLMGTNDVAGLKGLVDNVRAAKASYAEIGQDFSPSLLQEVLDNAVAVDSQTMTISSDDIFKSLGLNADDYNFTPEERAAMGLNRTVSRPGTMVVDELPGPAESMSSSEIEGIEKRIIKDSVDLAKRESRGYTSMVQALDKGGAIYESLKNQPEALASLKTFVTDQTRLVSGALDGLKGENPSTFDLMNLYGMNAFDKYDEYYGLTNRGVPIQSFEERDTRPVFPVPLESEQAARALQELFNSYGISHIAFQIKQQQSE